MRSRAQAGSDVTKAEGFTTTTNATADTRSPPASSTSIATIKQLLRASALRTANLSQNDACGLFN